jgi:inhibitor of cysteine peptidase
VNPLVRKAIAFSLVLVSLFALFAGMALSDEGGTSTEESILPAFKSTRDLIDHLATGSDSGLVYGEGNGLEIDDGESSHSETNIQVEGVDEMDKVKTDGSHLFMANFNGIHIIKAYPVESLSNLSFIPSSSLIELSLENFTVSPQGIFLDGDNLVVISMIYDWGSFNEWDESIGGFTSIGEMTAISLVNVSDPSSPVLEKSWGISGYVAGARMVGGVVYVICQDWIGSIHDVHLPMIMAGNDMMELDGSDVRYDPQGNQKDGYINLMAIDVKPLEFETLSVLGGWTSTIYMSHGSIYLAMRNWEPVPLLGSAVAGNEVSSNVMSSIFSIEVSGTSMQPVAKGEVPGRLLNQFSLDEYEGFLRVVTTTSWEPPENCVFVLDQELNVTGSLTGIAPSETVQAARFYGDVLYLVTFQRIDPLFVIDLGDRSNPVVLGELEVPGFSAYLHRIDQDRVIGIGMENSSVKVAMYDVSDPFSPIELSRYLVEGEYSYTEALWDHHAILIDVQKGLLVIPLRYHNSSDEKWIHGTAVFNISDDEVNLRGTIDLGEWSWTLRSVYIDDLLYSISTTTIMVNDIADLSEVNLLVYQSQLGYWGAYPEVGILESLE